MRSQGCERDSGRKKLWATLVNGQHDLDHIDSLPGSDSRAPDTLPVSKRLGQDALVGARYVPLHRLESSSRGAYGWH